MILILVAVAPGCTVFPEAVQSSPLSIERFKRVCRRLGTLPWTDGERGCR